MSDIWLEGVHQELSPNHNDRPNNDVRLIVLHNISLPAGQFGGRYVYQLFTNCLNCHEHADFADLDGLEVSTHLFIDRFGTVTQFVPLNKRAWHAGESMYKGKPNCNDFSIGIELEGDDFTPYTDAQYLKLIPLIQSLRTIFTGIGPDDIVGHSDIAPGRKTDPGPAFDWQRLRGET